MMSQGNGTLGDDTHRFYFVGDGVGSDGWVFLDTQALAEYSAEALALGFWRSLWLLARGLFEG